MKIFRKIGLDISAVRRVYAAFFLYALALGGLYPRMAEVQRSMGVAEGALGLGLIGTAAGTLISLTFGATAGDCFLCLGCIGAASHLLVLEFVACRHVHRCH